MELVQDDSGTEVLLNGRAWSCYNDTDCPGAAICAVNQTWAAEPGGWCMCYTARGLGGGLCNQWCAQGIWIFVMNMVIAIIGLALFGLASAIIYYKLLRQNERNIRTVVAILAFAGWGALFYVVGMFIGLANTLGFSSFFIVTLQDGRYLRRSPQATESSFSVFMALAGCVSICSLFILPLAWIQIAQRALRLKKQVLLAVTVYAIFFVLVLICVQFPLYMLSAANFRSDFEVWGSTTLVVWYVVLSLCAFTNVVAFWKITKVKALGRNPYPHADFMYPSQGEMATEASSAERSRTSSSRHEFVQRFVERCCLGIPEIPPPPRNTEGRSGSSVEASSSLHAQAAQRFTRRLYLLILRIQIASLSIATLCVLICILDYVQSPRYSRTPYSNPSCAIDPYDAAYRLTILFTEFALAVVIWFLSLGAFQHKAVPTSFRGMRPGRAPNNNNGNVGSGPDSRGHINDDKNAAPKEGDKSKDSGGGPRRLGDRLINVSSSDPALRRSEAPPPRSDVPPPPQQVALV